jgi:hypothetical protein
MSSVVVKTSNLKTKTKTLNLKTKTKTKTLALKTKTKPFGLKTKTRPRLLVSGPRQDLAKMQVLLSYRKRILFKQSNSVTKLQRIPRSVRAYKTP